MTDTLDDIDPPYRSGDSDKAERKVTLPTVEDAMRRIDSVYLKADDPFALDLIVVMREIGRLMAQNANLAVALRYVLEDDGLMPRATSECRDVVRAALKAAGHLP
jgi:hypothetical protein